MSTHCRCRSRSKCGKRFTGTPGVTLCPACGGPSRLDKWANARPWKDPNKLCHCDAYWWSIKRSPHRLGSGLCHHNPKHGYEPHAEMPGVPGDYPF